MSSDDTTEQPPQEATILHLPVKDGPKKPAGKDEERSDPIHRRKGFEKLRALKCFDEVHKMVLDGFGVSALADFIQKEKHEYTHVSRVSLSITLSRYRKSLPAAEIVAARLPNLVQEKAAQIRQSMNEIDEMAALFRMQQTRINMDHQYEMNNKRLLPSMNNEMRLGVEMLRTSAQIKIDVGLTASVMGEAAQKDSLMERVAKRVGDTAVAKVLENPESRLRLQAIASKLLKMADNAQIEQILEAQLVQAKDVTPTKPPDHVAGLPPLAPSETRTVPTIPQAPGAVEMSIPSEVLPPLSILMPDDEAGQEPQQDDAPSKTPHES